MIAFIKPEQLRAIIGRFSGRERLVLIAALVFVGAALVDRLVVKPAFTKLDGLDAQIVEREQAIRRSLKLLAGKHRIQIQSAHYVTYLAKEKSENEQFTVILKEIETLATAAGVNLLDLKPSGVKTAAGTQKFLVGLNCEATMEQLMEFMYSLENARKLLTIEKYQLTPKSRDSQLVKASLTIANIVLP